MKQKYNYWASVIWSGGLSSDDLKSSTLKEAKQNIKYLKCFHSQYNRLKDCEVELTRIRVDEDGDEYGDVEMLYYKKYDKKGGRVKLRY